MISDGERRDAAARLREAELTDPGCFTFADWYMAAFIGSIAKAVELVDGYRLRERLADLIEPQSVEPEAVVVHVGPGGREMRVWACPACGEVISYSFDDYNPETDGPRYCSGCGRKVAKW